MHRFYIPEDNWNAEAPVLTGAEAHHCRNVLRLKPGDEVILFNGRGAELAAEIVSERAAEVHLRKLSETQTPPLACQITLAQAIPKGKNMDLIVQKVVEIGAAEIVPLISERTVVQFNEKMAALKQAKWRTIAIEAAKQCGQNWLPGVEPPVTFSRFFQDRQPSDLQLIGSLQSGATHLKKILAEYAAEHGTRPATVLILVGPEGDFTPAEVTHAISHGCRPITLGPIVLRVETAAIYCLSILSYELLL